MMGGSMTCKQQYCCGDMRHCTGPESSSYYEPQPLTMSMFATKADLEKARAHAAREKAARSRLVDTHFDMEG